MNYRKIGYVVGCWLIFYFFSITYNMSVMVRFDAAVSRFVQSFRNPALSDWFLFMTTFGSMRVYIPLSILLLVYLVIHKRFLSALLTVVSLYGADYMNYLLKSWYERPRPDVQTLITAAGYSFPSGHAMNATAFLGFVSYLAITEYRLTLRLKIILIVISSFIIFSIGLSRVYLGVHYPTDVLAGMIAGCGWLLLCTLFHSMMRRDKLQ